MTQVTEIEISKAREQFNRLVDILAQQPSPVLYVKRHQKRVFAVVGIEFFESLLETLEVLEDPEARAMLAASLEDIRHGRLISHEDLTKQLQ